MDPGYAIEKITDELDGAASSYIAYVELNNALTEQRVADALNRHPSFWVATMHSLQTSSLLGLARLFDENEKTFSVDWLFKVCSENLDAFSPSQVASRKSTPAIGKVVRERVMPFGQEEIKILQQKVRPARKLAQGKLKKVRNKVLAHSQRLEKDDVSKLFGGMTHQNILDAFTVVHSTIVTLRSAYDNGHAVTDRNCEYDVPDILADDVRSLVSELTCDSFR